MPFSLRRGVLATAFLAAGALALTACGGPDYESVPAVDFGADVAATPVNAVLAIGEPASVQRTDGNGTSSTVLLSVIDIIEGDPAIYEKWEEPEKFAGTVPYFMVIQTTYDTDDRDQQPRHAIFPVNDKGETTEYVVDTLTKGSDFASGMTDCPVKLPDYDEETNTEVSCIIALAAEGDEITGGMFNGEGYINNFDIGLGGSDPVYGPAPIQWSSTVTPGSVTLAAEPVAPGEPGTAVEPGSTVGVGEQVWLPEPGDHDTLIGVTVLDFIPSDVSFFDRYPNASEFTSFTPTFIVVQLQYPDDASAEKRLLAGLRPVQADGEFSQWMTDSSSGSFAATSPGLLECGLVLPVYDPETRTFVGCITALAEDGQPVTMMEYIGETYTATWANDELGYWTEPVVFTK